MSKIIFKKMLKFFDNFYWKNLIGVIIFLQIISNCGLGAGALKNVSLIVDPPTVRRNQHATLRCLYDLEGAALYQLKFYRGLREFYRYSPGDKDLPKTQIFPYPKIYVDPLLSNASQVVLKNITFGLSGNFSCEVSAEAPKFSTATAYYDMQVVELPDRRPMLWTDHDRYEPGDVLKANCSSPPSRPKTELTLTLNNLVVVSERQLYPTNDGLYATKLTFRLQLQSLHFGGPVPSPGNSLVLRCTAQIGNFYQEYTEIELGVPQRDPIPARVTSSSVADFTKSNPTIPQLTMAVLLIVIHSQNIHHMLFR